MMIPEQKQIKIAELCGWTFVKQSPLDKVVSFLKCWLSPNKTDTNLYFCPDYLNSLDAMAEAEAMLSNKEQYQYQCALFKEICGRDVGKFTQAECYKVRSATATQRADAFLITKGVDIS